MSSSANRVCAISSFPSGPGLSRTILLSGVLFTICLGLAYPTLNRYDPRKVLTDSASYSKLVTDGPSKVEGYLRFRVLEPCLARPIYSLAKGRVGSWDPVLFGLLVVNSFLVAGTASLLCTMGYAHFGNSPTALVGATLYLLNFATPNLQLAGLVDAGEAFFLMAVAVSMFFRRGWLLPALGILGSLTKESFVPFSVTMAGTWWAVWESSGASRIAAGFWIALMAIVEVATVTVIQSSISGHLIWPWQFALFLNSHSNHLSTFVASLVDKDSWYVLIWLLLVGLLRLTQFTRPWVWASASASLVALLLNAYHALPPDAGAIGRYIFSVAGPLLSLSAAAYLCGDTFRPVKGGQARARSLLERSSQ